MTIQQEGFVRQFRCDRNILPIGSGPGEPPKRIPMRQLSAFSSKQLMAIMIREDQSSVVRELLARQDEALEQLDALNLLLEQAIETVTSERPAAGVGANVSDIGPDIGMAGSNAFATG